MKSLGQLFIFVFLFAALVDCQNSNESTVETTTTSTTTSLPTTALPVTNVTTIEPPSANETTTQATTTTIVPSTSTESPIGNWTVSYGNGTICIMLQMNADFKISYNLTSNETKEKKLHLDQHASVSDKSNCSGGLLILDFDENSLTLNFGKNNNKVSLVNVYLHITYDEKTFPNATTKDHVYSTTNQNFFEAAVGKSYYCQANTDIPLSDNTKILVQDLHVEAFTEKHDAEFSTSEECMADEGDVSAIVPIAVGCALAGLVVIVLIAYLVGRRHKRQKGYESV